MLLPLVRVLSVLLPLVRVLSVLLPLVRVVSVSIPVVRVLSVLRVWLPLVRAPLEASFGSTILDPKSLS